jgi:tetratricopeptide (TPR) repeat protein
MKSYILTLAFMLCMIAEYTKAQNLTDLERANDAYFKKNYETAITYYNRYLQGNNRIPKVLFNRGVCLLNIGQYAMSILDFREVLKLYPTFTNIHYYLGLAYQKLGKYEEAIRSFEKESDLVESLRLISECYRSMGHYERANIYAEMAATQEILKGSATDWQRAPQQQTTISNNTQTNNISRPTGQQQTVNINSNSIDKSPVKKLMSDAQRFTEEGRYSEAEEVLTQIINYYQDNRKLAFDKRGSVRIHLKKYNEAIQDFDRSLAISPGDAWTLNLRGLAKMEIGLFNEAEKDFQEAIRINPYSPAKENLANLDIRKRSSIAKGDTQGPTIKILSPQLAEPNSRGLGVVSTSDSKITVVGIAEDVSGVREVQLNTTIAVLMPLDGTGQRFQFTATLPTQPGENTIYFVAKDAANNETKKMYKYVAYVPKGTGTSQPDTQITATEKFDSKKLIGKNYALLIGIDQYQHWDKLNNPVRDVNAIAQELKNVYGFEIDLLINPHNKTEIERKITEWASRNYQYNDQLLVFIAGHGFFIPHLEKGFIIPYDGLPAHMEKEGASWVSHEFIRNTLERSNSRHIFLVMDACYSGTFSPVVARNRGAAELSLSIREMVARKSYFKTRKYLTSGGKEYVPDGLPNAHSPFAAKFLEALRSRGKYSNGLLTINDIRRAVQNLTPQPHSGDFPNSDGDPEGDFFFIPIN